MTRQNTPDPDNGSSGVSGPPEPPSEDTESIKKVGGLQSEQPRPAEAEPTFPRRRAQHAGPEAQTVPDRPLSEGQPHERWAHDEQNDSMFSTRRLATVRPRPAAEHSSVNQRSHAPNQFSEVEKKDEGAPNPESSREYESENTDVIPGFNTENSREAVAASLDHKPVFPRVLQWVVAILTPLALIAGAVRLVASTGVQWLIYHSPGFPQDQFGYSTGDRVLYGSYGVDYLNNFSGRQYLSGITDGSEPVFSANEVAHMADVKSLVHLTYLVGAVAAVLMVVSFVVLKRMYPGGIRRGLFAGSIVTTILILGLAVAAVVGWDNFFTTFHKFFFSGGNWQFQWTDSLIRLYPPRYWMLSAALLGALLLIGVVTLLLSSAPTRRRRELARRQMESKDYGRELHTPQQRLYATSGSNLASEEKPDPTLESPAEDMPRIQGPQAPVGRDYPTSGRDQ